MWVDGCHLRGGHFDVHIEQSGELFGLKGEASGQCPEQDHAKGVDVGTRIDFGVSSTCLFWAHKTGGAHDLSGDGHALSFFTLKDFGDPKIEDLDDVVLVEAVDQKDIGRFEIAVYDGDPVCLIESHANLSNDGEESWERHTRGVFFHDFGQRESIKELHDIVESEFFVVSEVHDMHDIFVVDFAGDACFASESLDELFVGAILFFEDFDGNLVAKLYVLCQVHDAEATASNALEELEICQLVADVWIIGEGGEAGAIFHAYLGFGGVSLSALWTNFHRSVGSFYKACTTSVLGFF